MNYRHVSLSIGLWAAFAGCHVASCQAAGFLSPEDFIISIDIDPPQSFSEYPGGESPSMLVDGSVDTKYLNFGGRGSGFIVSLSEGQRIAQSLQLWTANDSDGRDPTSYQLFGTNQSILSADNSSGLGGESWNLISEGSITMPAGDEGRKLPGGVVSFANTQSYSSYKMLFPTVRWPIDEFQLSEAQIYSDVAGTMPLLGNDDAASIRGIHYREFDSSIWDAYGEVTSNVIDGDPNSKVINYGWKNTGFIVTPEAGSTTIAGFRITTGNDASERDPTSWVLWGTNDDITSADNSDGAEENWTMISSGSLNAPFTRNKLSDVVPIDHSAGAFSSYKLVFPTIRTNEGGPDSNSMQISELEFFEGALPLTDPLTLRVNPQTGMMSIVSTVDFTISNYEISSNGIGALRFENWNSIADGNGSPNGEWVVDEGDGPTRYSISERLADGEEGGLQLIAGVPFDLGEIWMPVPFPDLSFTVFTDQGAIQADGVQWTTGAPVTLPGDFNMSGVDPLTQMNSLTVEDWAIFRTIWGATDFAGLTRAEAYLNGDMDGDFDSDLDDFNLFLDIAAARGGFLFSESSTVPEPSTIVALGLLVSALLVRRGIGRKAIALGLGVLASLVIGTAPAFALTFTNPYGAPVAYSSDTASQSGGTGLEQLFDDFYLDDPNEFPLEINQRNFADVQFGEFEQWGTNSTSPTIFLDYGTQINPNWFAYAQRHEDGNFGSDRVGKFEFWFSNSSFNNTVPTRTPDTVYEYSPGDNRLNGSLLRATSLGGEFEFQYAAVRFNLMENSPQPHNIGGHEFRFIDGPSDLILEINRGTGAMTFRNNGASNDTSAPQDIDIRGYSIRSESGAFDANDFTGLGGNPGFPEGNGLGSGWEVGLGSDEGQLVEGYFGGPGVGISSTIVAGTSSLPLGAAYDIYSFAEDVKFTWTERNGFIQDGRVVYVGDAPTGIPGDYNGDGAVNLADYTVWRDTLGATGTELAADGNGDNVVDTGDYTIWKGNFGESVGPIAGVSTAQVPEPSTLLVFALGGLLLLGRARLSR